ncbi:MAG: hypothetical protein ACRD25_10315, partial [Terracidiphilus sp.]
FMEHLRNKPVENLIWVYPIALAEVEAGLRMTATTDPQRRARCRRFIEDEVAQFVHPIQITTRESYALIMERIWRVHPPAIGGDTQEHLSSLNVQINDVWIAAVALERGLILLTHDGMVVIRECAPELNFEDWLE